MKNIIIGIALTLMASTSYASQVLLETFTQEDSLYQGGGWVLWSQDSYLGVKFSVDDSMHIDDIVANVGGNGGFFTGIVQLDGADSVPDVAPGFDPDSLLFYSTNTYQGTTSTDIRTQADVLLGQGDYAVIFGGLEDTFGWMPGSQSLENSTIPLTDYIEYRSEEGGWVTFDYSGIRVVLEGELNPVPLPPAVLLFLSGLSVILLRFKRRAHSS